MSAPAARRGGWGDAPALAGLLACAAVLRWVVWQRTVAIFDDGPRFLAIARAIDAGEWSAALRDSFHPLYPALTAALHRLLGGSSDAASWEAAGAGVSVIGGAAAVGFLFLFLRDAFGRVPAWCGAIVLAVHARAVEYASDVQSDGLYLGLFLAGVWLGWRAWQGRSAAAAAGAGLAAGLAYASRPEGLGLVLVLGGLGVFEIVRRRWPAGAGIGWLAALGAGALLCVAPYVVAVHGATGEWALTRKKPVGTLVRAAPVPTPGAPAEAPTPAPGAPPFEPPTTDTAPAPSPPLPPWTAPLGSTTPSGVAPDALSAEHLGQDGLRVALATRPGTRAWEALRMLGRHARSALGYGALALLLAGWIAARGRPGSRAGFLAWLVGLFGVVLFAQTFASGYVSRRHALPPLVTLFGWVGLGACFLGAGLARLARQPARAGVVAVLLLVVVAEGARSWPEKRADAHAERAAAEWLRDHAAPGLLAAPRQRLGYYAEMPYVSLSGIADDALGRYLSDAGARYVLLDDRDRVEALLRTEGGTVRLLHHLEASGREAWLLERVAPAAGR